MKRRNKQKAFENREISIEKLQKDYEKIQRLDEKRLSTAV